MPENEIDISAEFGAAIERFRTAWRAYADMIKPDKVEKEKELDHNVLERLNYYNDPKNSRHPDIIKLANGIRADMLLLDFSSMVTGPKSVLAARVAVDERLEVLTAELGRVLEALPALPPLMIETLTKITQADVGAWTAIRTEAEKEAAAAATEGIVLAHAFAALLEASVDAIELRTNALEHYAGDTPSRANTIIEAALESLTEVTAAEVAHRVLKDFLNIAAAPAAAIVSFAEVVYAVRSRVGKIPEYYKAGDVDELYFLRDGLGASQELASSLEEALGKLPSM
ncbi:MAG TPA: hypothetical protein VMU32_02655 [Solirubrobacteraceae bacterium]|nr:hypothetical protein [Solirubrobacteraceae bacterium]